MPLSSNNLIPLYWTGLCEAVIITPPAQASSLSDTPTPGVVTSPKSITLIPTEVSPALTAAFSI